MLADLSLCKLRGRLEIYGSMLSSTSSKKTFGGDCWYLFASDNEGFLTDQME